MAHRYDIGAKAWQPSPEEGWIGSEVIKKILDKDVVRLIFRLENGQVGFRLAKYQSIERVDEDSLGTRNYNVHFST